MSNTHYRLNGIEGTAEYIAERLLRRNGFTGRIPAPLLADTIREVEYHGDARPPARSIPEGWTSRTEADGTQVWSHPERRQQVIRTSGERPCQHPNCEVLHGQGPWHTVMVNTRWFVGKLDEWGYLDGDEVDSRVDGFWRAR
jgi:hypothetical protein